MPRYWRSASGFLYEIQGCLECYGVGSRDGNACFYCEGQGIQARFVTCSWCLSFAPEQNCPSCHGTGIAGYAGLTPPEISEIKWWEKQEAYTE